MHSVAVLGMIRILIKTDFIASSISRSIITELEQTEPLSITTMGCEMKGSLISIGIGTIITLARLPYPTPMAPTIMNISI